MPKAWTRNTVRDNLSHCVPVVPVVCANTSQQIRYLRDFPSLRKGVSSFCEKISATCTNIPCRATTSSVQH